VDGSHHAAYREFLLSSDIQERARSARAERGRQSKHHGPQGRYVNLEPVFDDLNRKYFGGTIPKPRLSWSHQRSRSTLGRYDATHGAIFISRIFDNAVYPPFVLEYVMFHEMLHIKHPASTCNSRRIVHSREFRAEERTFPDYERAQSWLKLL
jgi:predicted metal-dependent hydrolase